jgi:hypothetical protein
MLFIHILSNKRQLKDFQFKSVTKDPIRISSHFEKKRKELDSAEAIQFSDFN